MRCICLKIYLDDLMVDVNRPFGVIDQRMPVHCDER